MCMAGLLALVSACEWLDETFTASAPVEAASAEVIPADATRPSTPPAVASPTPSVSAAPAPSAAPVPPPAATLATLIDLLPSDGEAFVVVRDPRPLFDGVAEVVRGAKAPIEQLIDTIAGSSTSTDAVALRQALAGIEALHDALPKSALRLDEGVVWANRSTGGWVIIAVADRATLPDLARHVAPEIADTIACTEVSGHSGWVVCAADREVLATYVPGGAGAAFSRRLTAELGHAAVEAADAVMRTRVGGDQITFAMRAADGLVQIDGPLPGGAPFDLLLAGPAQGMGLVPPRTSFLWSRVDGSKVIARATTSMSAAAKTVISALSGELLLTGLADGPGVSALLGITDATPVAGIVPMVELVAHKGPVAMPDGSKLEFAVEEVADGKGGTLQSLRASIEPAPALARALEVANLGHHARLLVSKQWLALGISDDEAHVARAASFEPAASSSLRHDGLPPSLVEDLAEGKASWIVHLELDVLHSPEVRTRLEAAIAEGPSGAVPVEVAMTTIHGLLATVSSSTVWTSLDGERGSIHLALRGLGCGDDAERRAALAASNDVVSGARDPATAYDTLAAAHAGSRWAPAYRARVGREPRGTAATIAVAAFATVGLPPSWTTSFARAPAVATTITTPGAGGPASPRGKTPSGPHVRLAKTEIRGAVVSRDVRRVVQSHLGEARACYRKALATSPGLAGRVALQFTVGPSGTVPMAVVQSSTVKDVGVGSCVAKATRAWKFPKPSLGNAVVTQTLVFAGG